LSGFDFSQSSVNEVLIRQLHHCEFVNEAHNVVLIGGPGKDKTHLATGLCMQALNTIGYISGSSQRLIW